jgi:hypothetical protein
VSVYETIGHGYAKVRRPDPRIEARLHQALGDVQTVVNVGHGLPAVAEDRAVTTLAADLASGAWDERHGHWRRLADYDGGLRLIVSTG